jgi:hypothetical protein
VETLQRLRVEPYSSYLERRRKGPIYPVTRAGDFVFLCGLPPLGAFSLNGGGARLGEIGDVCIVMTFEMSKTYNSARVVYCDEKEVGRYMHATETEFA